MATVSIITCDGTTECQEAVTCEVQLKIFKQAISTVLVAARRDSCPYHIGDLVTELWQAKESLMEIFIDQEVLDADSQGWRFHSIIVSEQG